MKQFLFGLLISAAAIAFLVYKLDWNDFKHIQEHINYWYLIPFLVSSFFAMILFAWRWYVLLDRKISLRKALASSFLGVGGNMFLPARGGDVLRIYHSHKCSQIEYPGLVSRFFLEKVIDLVFIMLVGMLSFVFLGASSEGASGMAMFGLSGVLVAGTIVGLALLRFKNPLLITIMHTLFRWVRMESIFERKLKNHIEELGEFLRFKRFAYPVCITFLIWLIGYAVNYTLVQYLIGIHLTYTQTLFILFCGAVGVMVPSAPSGAGVIHASITSGFVLLGKKSAEGLIFATAFHLCQFLVLGTAAIVVYLHWSWTQGKPKINQELS